MEPGSVSPFSSFGFIFWSVIFVVMSGWTGSINPLFSSSSKSSYNSILVAAVNSGGPVRRPMSSDGRTNHGENKDGEMSTSDVKAVAGQSLQLLCPIANSGHQVAQEPIYWMKGKKEKKYVQNRSHKLYYLSYKHGTNQLLTEKRESESKLSFLLQITS